MSRCVNTVRLKNIKNKIMEIELTGILTRYKIGMINQPIAIVEILSLMGEKEIGGSDALPSNGVLHGVRECNVSGADSDKEASVNGSLEKITDTENFFCIGCGEKLNTSTAGVWCGNPKCIYSRSMVWKP